MAARGVVAAGHPLTAEAGARVLRDGGNAVDAAIAAVLTSFVTESPLTGLGAGGYMLVHDGTEPVLLDFFVAAPGLDGKPAESELVPVPVRFTPENVQTFHVGAASCGVPGTPAGLATAALRFGTVPLADLAAPAAALARAGVVVKAEQAYLLEILDPVLNCYPEARVTYAPEGRPIRAGERFAFPDLGDALERLGAEGAEPFYRGDIAAAIADWVRDRGGALGRDDLAVYEPAVREPVMARYRGRQIFTNPPPSSGGILIAFALALLERIGPAEPEQVVGAMESAQAARTGDFVAGLLADGFAERFLAPERLAAAGERLAAGQRPSAQRESGSDLGSTTHITAVDGDRRCASVTCSNGTGSGLIVPGTGVHVNNMLGEQDLNPLGFHRHPPGARMPSMMAPTIVLDGAGFEAGLGSGGSNRIRSAILQTVVRLLGGDTTLADAVLAPRMHFEDGLLQVEPGFPDELLERLEARGYRLVRWPERNLFFGGVHAVARDPGTRELRGGGDPRRGGAVAYA